MSVPLIDVAIVSHGRADLLRRTLLSLDRHPPQRGPLAVHVVDNASPDGTADVVVAEFPHVVLTRLHRNAGFAHATNIALRAGRAPFALLLNPDAEVLPGTLDGLLATLEARPEAGMVGPRLVRPDGRFDHAAKRSFPTPLAALSHFAGAGSRYRATELGERETGEVDAINGAFMLARREAVETVGLLDEGFWLYMEDLDWCARFHAAGWKVLYDGRFEAIHVKGGTAGMHRALRQNWHFHRGMGRFYRAHQAGRRPLVDLAVYTGVLAKFALSATRSAIARR